MSPIPEVLATRLHQPFVPQEAFDWPQKRWEKWLPNESCLESLADYLSRETVAAVVADDLKQERAREAFITVMVWGVGSDGRGPARTAGILKGERSGGPERVEHLLLEGARKGKIDGPVEGYQWMNNEGRIYDFASSFFTKWLSFASAQGDPYGPSTAPILDDRIIDWFARNAKVQLKKGRTDDYEKYVNTLKEWGSRTSKSMAQVETVIFGLTREEQSAA